MTRWCVMLVAFSLAAAGCGGSQDLTGQFGGEEGKKIADLIGEFEELTQRPKQFEKAFVGAAPKGLAQKKYIGLQYNLVGKPAVNGESATATIVVEKSATGDKVGEVTWEFAKVDGTWKIKTAPLK